MLIDLDVIEWKFRCERDSTNESVRSLVDAAIDRALERQEWESEGRCESCGRSVGHYPGCKHHYASKSRIAERAAAACPRCSGDYLRGTRPEHTCDDGSESYAIEHGVG